MAQLFDSSQALRCLQVIISIPLPCLACVICSQGQTAEHHLSPGRARAHMAATVDGEHDSSSSSFSRLCHAMRDCVWPLLGSAERRVLHLACRDAQRMADELLDSAVLHVPAWGTQR